MSWEVALGDEFDPEFQALPEEVQDAILAAMGLLQQFGPTLGRPRVDTLNGSRHSKMKELRIEVADGVWRIAFAFDLKRKAVLLVAGDKSGVSKQQFYRALIGKADDGYDAHLARTSERERGYAKKPRRGS